MRFVFCEYSNLLKHMVGGIEIDLETHVLDENGERIPGLLA
jgi:predicted oxidoreductase